MSGSVHRRREPAVRRSAREGRAGGFLGHQLRDLRIGNAAGRGYWTLAVAMQYDRPDRVIDYNERNRLPFPIAIDLQGDIARAFDDTRVTPTTFLIDTQGRIVKRYIGAPDFAELQRRIEALLAS